MKRKSFIGLLNRLGIKTPLQGALFPSTDSRLDRKSRSAPLNFPLNVSVVDFIAPQTAGRNQRAKAALRYFNNEQCCLDSMANSMRALPRRPVAGHSLRSSPFDFCRDTEWIGIVFGPQLEWMQCLAKTFVHKSNRSIVPEYAVASALYTISLVPNLVRSTPACEGCTA